MGITAGAGAAIAGGAAAGGGILSGLLGSSGAQAAGKQQAWANQMAALMAQQRYEQTRSDLSPYNTTGQSMLGPLSTYYQQTQGQLDQAFKNAQDAIPTIPNQATILQMPGYQFNLDQGLKATQAQETAKGLGLSGAATKAAQNYATGLSQNYLQQYFNMGQQQFADQSAQLANAVSRANTVFQQIGYPASLGENAAAQVGNTGANLANTTAASLGAAGQAQATGTATSAGALGSGLQNAANSAGNGLLAYALLNQNQPYTGPSAGALLGSQGDPATIQGMLGLGSDQQISDPRVKATKGKTSNALQKVNAIPVTNARYVTEAPGNERPMMMAPDVQRQVPQAVTGTPGGNALQTIKTNELMPLLVASVQDLSKKVAKKGGK